MRHVLSGGQTRSLAGVSGAPMAAPLEGPTGPASGGEEGIVHSIAGILEGLMNGSDAQKSLILFEVQQLVSNAHSIEYALKTLVPAICDNVPEWSPDLQICAAEALVGIQVAKLPHELALSIKDTAFLVLQHNQDPNMFRAWGEILVSILPHVKWSRDELVYILTGLDEERESTANCDPHQQSLRSPAGFSPADLAQKLTARIIGPIAVSATPQLVKDVLLPRALSLTADPDIEVRGMVVESLAFIGAAIDIKVIEDLVWPCLAVLVRDSNARLRAATLRTISRIAASHRKMSPGSKLFTDLLPPIFIRECTYLKKQAQADQRLVDNDTYLLIEINAEVFGELLFSCHEYLNDETSKKIAFRAFQAMATCNGPVVRRHCAFNVPGVATSVIKKCHSDLTAIVEFLTRDADAETRKNLAAGMHETSKVLISDDTVDALFKCVTALLKDNSPLVRMSVLQNLDNLLGTLANHNPYKAMRKLETVFQNMHLLAEGNWRTQELLAKQLRLVAPLVPPQSIRDNVLPLLYSLTQESSYTVRKASMAAVAVCMRYLPDTTERDKAMKCFRVAWGRGHAFWMRIGFIDSAVTAVETYSRILFRDTFATELLAMSSDPVANIRIRIAELIPTIAPACHQMEEFNSVLELLQNDTDKDVIHALLNVEERIQEELAAGKKSFERDMTREAEEQKLYARHLQLKAEVRKKHAGVKHNTKVLLGALSPRNTGGSGKAGEMKTSPGDLGETPSGGRPRLPKSSTFNGKAQMPPGLGPKDSGLTRAKSTTRIMQQTAGKLPASSAVPTLPRGTINAPRKLASRGVISSDTQEIVSPTSVNDGGHSTRSAVRKSLGKLKR